MADSALAAIFTSVTIAATDAMVTEAGTTTGAFTGTRTGPTASALSVNFTIAGSATNGSDYSTITSPVTIPAGFASTIVTITPTDDTDVEADERSSFLWRAAPAMGSAVRAATR